MISAILEHPEQLIINDGRFQFWGRPTACTFPSILWQVCHSLFTSNAQFGHRKKYSLCAFT